MRGPFFMSYLLVFFSKLPPSVIRPVFLSFFFFVFFPLFFFPSFASVVTDDDRPARGCFFPVCPDIKGGDGFLLNVTVSSQPFITAFLFFSAEMSREIVIVFKRCE